ncbi:membrane protein insertase YidC [Granulicella sp. 5B5]|uniref:membrane protein insertase YidC n=1 Tax=Granulicella sp. 5B5 TaxID=1617967 RepID=UPI0015F54BCE|nr:membrane protein insertase YidC [Granulicella sp. 5B5]QMV18795.1 membrane protein insertase YidC [Granulicella sp. 5B5]
MPEIRNPNQAGGQDSRSLLVMMIVILGVLFGVQYWRGQHTPEPPAAPAAHSTQASPTATPAAPTAPAAATTAASQATPAIAAASESTTTVENELYKITFSNRGGQVTSWLLKRYTGIDGHPLDLVQDTASKLYGYPLSLYTYEPALNQQLATALYVPSATGTLQSPASLTFKYAAGDIAVTKTFTFGADYVISADTQVLRNGQPIRALLSWPAAFGDMDNITAYAAADIDTSANGHDDHTAFKKVSGGATLNGPFDFAGTSDQYFAAAFLPMHPQDATLVTLHHEIPANAVPAGPGRPSLFGSSNKAQLPLIGAAVGDLSGHNQLRLYVGPKAIDVLKSVHTADGHDLQSLLDFGFFGPIGKYLFLGLHWVHSLLPHDANNLTNFSWGWAIVIFTVLINVVLLPLRIKGMKSMLAMQRIQPGIDAIKAKYKNPKATDPKAAEMNAEVMAYQKQQGVSMFGGCVPSLIQLPLLFAFFTMMTKVVELRHAHFFWLHDLSAADQYHILPILMVITSFLVQFYTPSPGVDPQQQKMMAFMMPAFSGWMTWNYASGLALYWNVGNIIMIIQQAVMNNTQLGKEMKVIAANRAKAKAAAASRPNPKIIQGRR